MRIARQISHRLVPLLLLALLAGCSAMRGLGQDIQDGSHAFHAMVWGDDPDAPSND